MHPRTLVADVRHLKEVFVEPGIGQGLLEERFVGEGTAGSHNDLVQFLVPDDLGHLLLGVLRATEEVMFDMNDVRQILGIFRHPRDIYHTGDVGPAAADEYTHPGDSPRTSSSEGISWFGLWIREGSKRLAAVAAAALESMTQVGISLGA